MNTLRVVLLGAAALMATTGLTVAQERLRPMGEIKFAPEPQSAESDSFKLSGRDQRLRSFKIEMDEGAAEIRDIRITYADGGRERVRVRQPLNEGQSTSLIRLQDDEPVASIEVTYIPRGAVTLILQGDARRPEPPPPPPAQWAELGCKTVSFFGDRDILPVNNGERYRALRLRSVGFDIELNEMGVVYGNGTRDSYSINRILPSGATTNEIPLRGEARKIRQVDFLYRSKVISNKKTRLCVDGLAARAPDEDDDE
jgi:hypothetical protein